jgi:hypothetical protein
MSMADFLDQAFPEAEAPEAEVVETPNPVPETVAEAPAPEPVIPEVQDVVVPEKPEAGFIPIAALMDERDKRRALEERIRQFESQQPQAQPAMPDPYDSPEEFAAAQQAIVDQRITQVRFEMSDRFAKQAHGEEKVSAAVEWAKGKAESDPVFAAGYMRDPDPIGWIVKQHDRDGLVSQIGDRSIDDFVKDYISKNPGLIGVPVPAAVAPVAATLQPAPKPAAPPRSIAGDNTPLAPTQTGNAMSELDAIFSKR